MTRVPMDNATTNASAAKIARSWSGDDRVVSAHIDPAMNPLASMKRVPNQIISAKV
jgi:hypothetical protein